MRRLDLRRTWCAVLGVCDGGSYQVGPGDEPYGLVAAMLTAGSRCVASAQWAVDDEAARALVAEAPARIWATGSAQVFAEAAAEHCGTGAPVRGWAAIVTIGADAQWWGAG
jgi:hypothetical protein